MLKSAVVWDLIVLGPTPEGMVVSGDDSQLSAYKKKKTDPSLHLSAPPASSHMWSLLSFAASCAVWHDREMSQIINLSEKHTQQVELAPWAIARLLEHVWGRGQACAAGNRDEERGWMAPLVKLSC